MTVSHSAQMLLKLEKCIPISHVTLETVPKYANIERPTSSQLYASQIFYVTQLIKCALKKVKCHACNFVNFGAYNAAILFVLRSRLTILRQEDDKILDHDWPGLLISVMECFYITITIRLTHAFENTCSIFLPYAE